MVLLKFLTVYWMVLDYQRWLFLMYFQFCDRGSPASGGRRGCGPAAPPNRFSPRGGRRVIQNCLGRHKLDWSRSWFLHLLDRRQPPGKLFAEKWCLQFLRATSLLQECGTGKVPRPNIGIAILRFADFLLNHCSMPNWSRAWIIVFCIYPQIRPQGTAWVR